MCGERVADSQGATPELHETAGCAGGVVDQLPRTALGGWRQPIDSAWGEFVKRFLQKGTKETKASGSRAQERASVHSSFPLFPSVSFSAVISRREITAEKLTE